MFFALSDIALYGFFAWFLIAAFFSWFVPGWVLISRVKLHDSLAELLLALPAGIAFWGVQGYVFGYAGLRWLSFVYILLAAVFFWRERRYFLSRMQQARVVLQQEQPWLLSLAVVLSSGLQILGHVMSGLVENGKVTFYFLKSSVMHLAYIQSLSQTFPPVEPSATQLPLENYHYWSDLVLADIARVWQIPVAPLFFQYAPIMLSLCFTLLIVRLVYALKGSHRAAAMAVFLFTLGADAAYVFSLILHREWGASISMIDSGLVHYFNIPQVFARLVFVAVVFLLLHWWKKHSYGAASLAIVLSATLFGFKIYYGLYAVLGICVVGVATVVIALWQRPRFSSALLHVQNTAMKFSKEVFLIAILAVLSLAIYLPPNKASGGLFYAPLEWPKVFLSSGQLDFSDWWLRMQVYQEAGNTRNILILNTLAIGIALVCVFGTRLIGALPTWQTACKVPWQILIFFLPVNALFLFLGLFTLQRSGGLNVYNFFIVPVVSFNVLAALNVDSFRPRTFWLLMLLFVPLTLPRTILKFQEIVVSYQQSNTTVEVSRDEQEALQFLREYTSSESIVQSHPDNAQDVRTPYVAFFSQRDSFLAGVTILESHNQPVSERETAIKEAFLDTDPIEALRSLGVSYVYLVGEQGENISVVSSRVVFENETVRVISTAP